MAPCIVSRLVSRLSAFNYQSLPSFEAHASSAKKMASGAVTGLVPRIKARASKMSRWSVVVIVLLITGFAYTSIVRLTLNLLASPSSAAADL